MICVASGRARGCIASLSQNKCFYFDHTFHLVFNFNTYRLACSVKIYYKIAPLLTFYVTITSIENYAKYLPTVAAWAEFGQNFR